MTFEQKDSSLQRCTQPCLTDLEFQSWRTKRVNLLSLLVLFVINLLIDFAGLLKMHLVQCY